MSTTRLALLFLPCFAAFPLSARAQESAPPAEVASAFAWTRPYQEWYGICMKGTKIGWGRESLQPGTLDGRPVLIWESRSEMRIRALGEVMTSQSRERRVFAAEAPWPLLRVSSQSSTNDEFSATVVTPDPAGGPARVTITEAGETRTLTWPDFSYTLTDQRAEEAWTTRPDAKPGDTCEGRDLDLEQLKISTTTDTLIRRTEWSGNGVPLPAWEITSWDPDENATLQGTSDATTGRALSFSLEDVIAFHREPEETARAEGKVLDIISATLVPADKKLGDSARVRRMTVEITGDEIPDFPQTAWQRVERAADGKSVKITSGEGAGDPVPATEEEIADALKSTPALPVDLPAVAELARKAVAGASTPEEKVRRLVTFVSWHVTDDMDGGPSTLPGLLANPRGDCTEHTLLFTALARAAGIPCREVSGWLYFGDDRQAFGGHAWNEVVLDGHWVPVDSTWTQTTPDGARIHCSSGTSRASDYRYFSGNLRIRILSVKRK